MLSQERITGSQECQRAWVEIDLAALAYNARQLKSFLSPQTELMAVIKADAYGHGAVMVAEQVLQHGVTWLGVATIPEGIELRQAGITAPILVLGAANAPAQVKEIAQWRLQPTLSTPKQALVFSDHLQETLPVHLMLDTGMARQGLPWQQGLEFVQFVRSLPNLSLAGIYSHLAMADAADPRSIQQQQDYFEQVIQQVRAAEIKLPRLHLANSAATLRGRQFHYDLVRVGLSVYGLYPAQHLKGSISLKPAMQVRSRITLIKDIQAGTGISYGHQYIADRPMRIAVVGIGYADGVPRLLSNRMQVLIHGQLATQVGAITMDQLMIDVSQIENVQIGDVVTLLGEDNGLAIAAEDWAETLGTISWEILCSFRNRLPRIPVH
ncbi:MAG: alanine racemase [Aphanocapsa sp. GSE-SYN-MK-11-07L]|jgi:alanine racemase|nr:alanine racemase [Aphanocapsa sp. GSE-SYN-MK-11-07L]